MLGTSQGDHRLVCFRLCTTHFLSLASLLLALLSIRRNGTASELFLPEKMSSDGPESAWVDLEDTPLCDIGGSRFCDCVRSRIC